MLQKIRHTRRHEGNLRETDATKSTIASRKHLAESLDRFHHEVTPGSKKLPGTPSPTENLSEKL